MKRPSWRLVVVSLAVVAVHLAVLIGWWRPHVIAGRADWDSVRALGRQPAMPPVRATVVTASPPVRQVPAVPLSQSQQEQREQAGPVAPAEAPPQPESVLPTTSDTRRRGPAQSWTPSPSDYLAAEQVDVFPRPVEEWLLNWMQVPRRQPGWQVTVRLWVSAAGVIDHVTVLQAQPPGDWAGRVLAPLPRTEMRPAMLAGQPVPVTYVVQLAPDQLP